MHTAATIQLLLISWCGVVLEVPSQALRLAVRSVQTDKAFQIEAELPGISKQDVKVSVDGDVLSLSVNKSTAKEDKKDENGVKYHRWGAAAHSGCFWTDAALFLYTWSLPSSAQRTLLYMRCTTVFHMTCPKAALLDIGQHLLPYTCFTILLSRSDTSIWCICAGLSAPAISCSAASVCPTVLTSRRFRPRWTTAS